MRRDQITKSKFLSLVLRHDPAAIGVELDAGGWIEVSVLLAALQRTQPDYAREALEEVVAANDKRRFVFSDDGMRIRAVQGHSLGVDLGLAAAIPPQWLYHGTALGSLSSIQSEGLRAGQRDYVHLSPDATSARQVGARHGRPVVLVIVAARMAQQGQPFYRAKNGVWLTRRVPTEFISFPEA